MNPDSDRTAGAEERVRLWRRLAALTYDGLLLVAILFLATAVALAAARGHLDGHAPWFRGYLVLVMYVFFAWFWTHGGQTLGMSAWKIRVERMDGGNIGWGQATVRFAVATATLGLGLLWAAFDPQGRALYDRAANTRMARVAVRYVPEK